MDWHELLWGDLDAAFLGQIGIRTVVMFFIILTALKILGKRGVKQLSVFELVIIISLGSAAGDPMFYREVGLLSALAVFVGIIVCYKITTHLVFKFKAVEKVLEGEPIYLIDDGVFSLENFNKEALGYDEFFSEMRQKSVSHLGQIDIAILEISGELSLYYYEDDAVLWGLPILPTLYNNQLCIISKEAHYSCSYCGYTEIITPTIKHSCPNCNHEKWVASINCKRAN
ncbi:DUF421 domain-containing protein [Flavobacterium antarcticum]|uniref:DUF421 domain-containing protein n=1 Tax=Flavobacterium antarcticum TaxID=271155 RepID=UPI0003B677FC|nr:YetF domain-containing protein [Flavobacterium antarcticum]